MKEGDLSQEDQLVWNHAASSLTYLAVKYGQAITVEIEPWVGFLPDAASPIGSSQQIQFEERDKENPRWVLDHKRLLSDIQE